MQETVDFYYIVGRGLLNDQAHEKLRDGATLDRIAEQIGVEKIMFHDGTTTVTFDDLTLRQGEGYFIFSFRCPNGFTEFDRYTELELHIRTYLSRGVGWYTYFTANTITDRLTVSFKAPFKVTGKHHLGKITTEAQNERLSGSFYSSFTTDEPVPVNSTVDWIFETKPSA